MQLFEISWLAARPGVNQHCLSRTTACERGRRASRARREGECEVEKFFCMFVYVIDTDCEGVEESRANKPEKRREKRTRSVGDGRVVKNREGEKEKEKEGGPGDLL